MSRTEEVNKGLNWRAASQDLIAGIRYVGIRIRTSGNAIRGAAHPRPPTRTLSPSVGLAHSDQTLTTSQPRVALVTRPSRAAHRRRAACLRPAPLGKLCCIYVLGVKRWSIPFQMDNHGGSEEGGRMNVVLNRPHSTDPWCGSACRCRSRTECDSFSPSPSAAAP